MMSGAVGGLPITGVIVRSSANVAAGARTRASAMMHGLWVLAFAVPFVGLIEKIPTAALAGLLIVIGSSWSSSPTFARLTAPVTPPSTPSPSSAWCS